VPERSRRRAAVDIAAVDASIWTGMRRVVAVCALAASVGSDLHAASRPPWTLISSRNVAVVGQQAPQTLRRIAIQIEQFRLAVGPVVRSADQPPPMPTIVYTFATREELEPYLPLRNGKPTQLAGYCHCGSSTNLNVIAASLAAYADSSAIIFHEYTHVLVRNAATAVPVWLNEGLAEYYSSFALAADGRKVEIGRPLDHHVSYLRQQPTIPLAELIAVDFSSPLYNESSRRSIFYAESWALTHYLLLERPGGAASISRYLEFLAAGASSERAFTTAFDSSLDQVDAALRQYIRRGVMKSSVLTLRERVDVDEPQTARVLTDAEVEARLAGLQLSVQRTAEAAPRIEAAAAAGPDVAEAQLALGLLRVQQDRTADAWTPLERAAALAPDDFAAQYTYALLLLQQDLDRLAHSRPSVERARAALIRAVAANPQSAEALAWQTFADLVLGEHIAEAHAAIRRAIELSPGRLDFRVREAEVLLREGHEVEARAVLNSVAHSAGEDAVRQQATSVLAAIDEGDRREAAERAGLAPVDRSTTAGGASPADDHQGRSGRPIVLRRVQPGEERAYGDLTAIDCNSDGIRLSLRIGSRVIFATARRLEDIVVRWHVDDQPTLACGPRSTPEVVFLTWRIATPSPTTRPGVVGEAVALEIVPRDYVP